MDEIICREERRLAVDGSSAGTCDDAELPPPSTEENMDKVEPRRGCGSSCSSFFAPCTGDADRELVLDSMRFSIILFCSAVSQPNSRKEVAGMSHDIRSSEESSLLALLLLLLFPLLKLCLRLSWSISGVRG